MNFPTVAFLVYLIDLFFLFYNVVLKEKREVDIAVFSELYRKLASQVRYLL